MNQYGYTKVQHSNYHLDNFSILFYAHTYKLLHFSKINSYVNIQIVIKRARIKTRSFYEIFSALKSAK